jgi:regulatory protein
MKITAREKSRDGSMYRIFLDGKYGFSIPQEAYITSFLYEREEITAEELDALKQTILVQSAREKAVKLLIAKDRSEYELTERLHREGYDRDIAQKAVEALKSIGYVNDTRYVLKYASDRMKNKAISRKALQYELEQKGVDGNLIREVLADFEQNDDQTALRAAKKKFGKYVIKGPEMERKVLSFLAHRGFSYEIASSVLKQLKQKEE